MTTVFCKFQVAGFHHWPDAPNRYAFLRESHRHVFHGRAEVSVVGTNREVEFIELKLEAQRAFSSMGHTSDYSSILDFGARSCEMMAEELVGLLTKAGYAVSLVEISEDAENGARVVV